MNQVFEMLITSLFTVNFVAWTIAIICMMRDSDKDTSVIFGRILMGGCVLPWMLLPILAVAQSILV